ncbi:MAG TPA: hypothetical protein VFR36_08420 [Sphingomicrobium sp.]|nr:hypothetical protein [Sphingomicrobium sp.]
MSQDILERPSSKPEVAGRDPKLLERLESIYRRNREQEFQGTVDRLEALRQEFRAEQDQLLSPDLRRSIQGSVVRGGDARGPGLRYQSLVKARENGLDLVRLKGLYERIYGKFDDIVKSDRLFTVHENVVGSVADILERPPFILPDPDKEKTYFPPYAGSWDRLEQNMATGDGRVDENFSYLDGNMARLGSRLTARNRDPGDAELICAYREGGYLVPFKTLKTGILQVKADLTALICKHHVSTYDEWGWSEFHATTRGRLILAIFWNWEDNDPANEVSDSWFVGGLDCSGDGESYPGTTVQATPGERRIVNLYTDMAFPAGQDLWVYVGLSDRAYAFLNDVEINISIDSAWQLNSIGIRSL